MILTILPKLIEKIWKLSRQSRQMGNSKFPNCIFVTWCRCIHKNELWLNVNGQSFSKDSFVWYISLIAPIYLYNVHCTCTQYICTFDIKMCIDTVVRLFFWIHRQRMLRWYDFFGVFIQVYEKKTFCSLRLIVMLIIFMFLLEYESWAQT